MKKDKKTEIDTQSVDFERLEQLMNSNKVQVFKKELLNLHFYDQGQYFLNLDEEGRMKLAQLLSPKEMGDMFDTLADDDPKTQEYLMEMEPTYAAHMLNEMYNDNAADILEHLDDDVVDSYLDLIPERDANKLRRLMHYGSDTAGGIMTTDMISLKKETSIMDAIAQIKRDADLAETINYLYVIDDERELIGVLSLRDILVAPEGTIVEDVMTTNVFTVRPEVDQAEVAHTIRDYGFLAVPVVDTQNRLIGMVTVDDIIEVIDDEAQSDYSGLAGVNVDDVSEMPVKSAMRRLPWLITLLFLGMLTATLINHFDVLLNEASILAVFISLITGTAGNAGTQSLAVSVRRLALSNDDQPSMWQMVISEILTGLLIGVVTGLTVTVLVGIWKHNFVLGGVIGLSMAVAIFVANMAGSLIPLGMDKIGFDPAVASGPFISTLSDLTSVLIYFNIASVFLSHMM